MCRMPLLAVEQQQFLPVFDILGRGFVTSGEQATCIDLMNTEVATELSDAELIQG